MKDNRIQITLFRYPFCGEISRCTDRGFGFVARDESEYFIHFRDHSGHKLNSMDGLEGKLCAFVIGGHPYRYFHGKIGWDYSVIKWQLLDDLSHTLTPQTYKEERKKTLQTINQRRLFSLLSANWYVSLWQNKIGEEPKAILQTDSALDDLLHERLMSVDGTEELIRLLAAIYRSPWYAITDEDRRIACQKFFQPSDWPEKVFTIRKPLKSCHGYNDVWPLCGKILSEYIRNARTISIDIESDGKNISQFGWNNTKGTGLKSNQEGLSTTELQEAVTECLSGQHAPCIVGHNLLNWDLRILTKHGIRFPESSSFWDTLISSLILEPWRASHALVVEKNAHRADADAEACYDLYNKQVVRLSGCVDELNDDITTIIERFFSDPTLLSNIGDREYPSDLQKKLNKITTVFPSCRKHEIAWQRGCHLELVSEENRLADPILIPECCRQIANEINSVNAKVVYIIVVDALSNDVEVHLSYLPFWLVNDGFKAILRDAHNEFTQKETTNYQWNLRLAKDFFISVSEHEIQQSHVEGNLSFHYLNDIVLEWLKVHRETLIEENVRETFLGVTEKITGRSLLPVSDRHGQSRWLLYEPTGFNAVGASWNLLPTIPEWLKVDQQPIGNISGEEASAWIPRWRDGNAVRLDVDHIFISPDTANRPLYLSDIMHCVLNLVKNNSEDKVFIIGLRWTAEAELFQRNLVQLGISSHHPGTPLRRLEHVCNHGLKVIACDRNEIQQFLQAAIRLRKNIQVVLDELPLHDWYAILNRPELVNTTVNDVEVSDIPDANPEDNENDDVEFNDFEKPANHQIILRGDDIRKLISIFLQGWLQSLLGPFNVESVQCLILDARLADHHTARALQIPRCDIPFFSLEELLDNDSLQVFFEICYPRHQEREIPNNYEAYKSFLSQNWGYEDFRSGTQRPAINALIQNNRDLLIRLPTGAGKSIIFHLPALLRSQYSGRLTVIITPLRALMRDQVEGLWQKGFTESVDYLSGGRDVWLNNEVYQGILDGRIRLVFVAPERFRVPRFTEALERRRRMDGGLEFVVFDEAHCISEWGFEFRPDYLYAAEYVAEWFKKKELPGNPHRLLLTSATVTEMNRKDMERELGLGVADSYEDLPEDIPHPIQPYIILESFDLHENQEAPSDEKFEKIIDILTGLDLERSAALVFVRRRKDCHRLCEALNAYAARTDSTLTSLHALPFHAGLPEAVKTEACDLLKDRKVNVLVCTKAFGMGMDIPHLHVCIHHRPPTYIEDYLQEVGRIGRDEGERIRAGHDLVRAILLYNQDNMDHNLALIHDKTVQPPDLQDFFAYCLNKSISFKSVEKALCIIPAKVRLNETKEFNESQVTNCLFWLERMHVLQIEGKHPPFIDLELNMKKLRRYSKGKSDVSKITAFLLNIVEDSTNVVKQLSDSEPQRAFNKIFSRVIKGLLRGALALISQPNRPTENTAIGNINVSVSIKELMYNCGGISMDDLFAGLFELNKANVLSIRKNFIVSRNGAPSSDEFWGLLDEAVRLLISPTGGKVEYILRKKFESELQNWYSNFINGSSTPPKHLTRRVQREVYRAISTSTRILYYAGVNLRERISDSGELQYAIVIPNSSRNKIANSANEIIRTMQKFVQCLSDYDNLHQQTHDTTFEVPLTDIIKKLGEGITISKIKKIIKLVESAGFYGVEGTLDSWVSLVTLNTKERLESYNPDSVRTSPIQLVYAEMLEKYELQVLRAQAMVLLAAMPSENRKEYIDRYFQCVKVEDIQTLLEDTVGDVDDEVLVNNPMLQDLLSQVRRERFAEEMERLNEKQLTVCYAPFNHNLLVNAGPGSGKTHVLMMRCAHLIHVQRLDPAEILVLAFNRAVVYEIRDRIRSLFRALGYGSYANRLDVSTFHSFALRYQREEELYEEDAIGKAVHNFANKMESDISFARIVGGRYKAILVDEFQDMNEDFYKVVKSLLTHCHGGGMVIGDDDQDILTWNRREWKNNFDANCPLEAVHYFSDFRTEFEPDEHSLTLNYRSAPEIVSRAKGMIEKVSNKLGFLRMKQDIGLKAFRSENGVVDMPFDPAKCKQLVKEALSRKENVAVLCRSNRECRQIYEELVGAGDITKESIELLGSEDFSLYQLRHCGALLDICHTRKDYEFVEVFIWDELLEEYGQRKLADLQKDRDYLNIIHKLIREEVGRPRIRDLQTFIREMRTSDVDRLKTKVGQIDNLFRLTIATVHKVKGLEYDTVLVMPSSENFPFRMATNGILPGPDIVDAAEEARLYYVAMTRARNRLYIGWGEREKNWWVGKRYENNQNNTHSYYLRGTPKELFVSWPGLKQQVQSGLQDYIEKQICLGDPIELLNRKLLHNGQVIGRISSRTAGLINQNNNMQLCVSNIIRYTCGSYFREHNPEYWNQLHEDVKRRGWFYLVLVEQAL